MHKIHYKKQCFGSEFFADPDPGKKLHADPDPGGIRRKNGKNDIFLFFFHVSDDSEQLAICQVFSATIA